MKTEQDTILYVDDDLLNLQLFSEYFGDKYQIMVCSNPLEVDNMLNTSQVKVIISDQSMPEESGLKLIQRLNISHPQIIKILFTAYSDHDLALEAINKVGIYRYLLKPWNFNEMNNAIENAIREYDLKMENKTLFNELLRKNNSLLEAYNKLKDSENKFFEIFSKSSDGIYIINSKKEIIEANQSFCKIMSCKELNNCEPKEISKKAMEKYPELINLPYQFLQHSNPALSEILITKDDQTEKYLEIHCSPFSIQSQKATLVIVRDITDRRVVEKRVLEAIINTQEEIQGKYARELHDGLGPVLSTLKMNIEWLSNPENTINKEKIIQHSINAINDAIRNVKEIANNLSPHILQRFGLVNAILTYIERMKETCGIEFVVSSNIKEKIPDNVEIILYRVMLECINNAVKHSGAQKVILKFNKQKNIIYIGYSDNGKGFDVEKIINNGQGMGIFNIKNRIRNIGGEFRIVSNPGIGTDIGIHLEI